MQKELNPVIVFGAIGVIAVVVIVVGYIVLGPKRFVPDTKGSEADMKRVIEKGEPMYRPPANVPGLGGAPGGGPPPGAPGPGMAPGAPMGR